MTRVGEVISCLRPCSEQNSRYRLIPFRICDFWVLIRYGAKSIPADQRYGKLCKTSKVEDEFHFVIECPIYEKERLNLLEYIQEPFKNIAELQTFDKFIWLMGQEDPLCILKFLQKATDIRQKEIQLRLLNK